MCLLVGYKVWWLRIAEQEAAEAHEAEQADEEKAASLDPDDKKKRDGARSLHFSLICPVEDFR